MKEIYNITGGHPFFIQAICHSLVEKKNESKKKGSIDLNAVNNSHEDVLFASSGMLEEFWHLTLEEEHRRFLLKFNLQDQVDNNIADDLVKQQILKKHEGSYHFAVPLLFKWIRNKRSEQA